MNTAETRTKIAQNIVNLEARRINGKIAIYYPPAGDGGGKYEIAGINERYHKTTAERLKTLIETRQYDRAEKEAAEHIYAYTSPCVNWLTETALQSESYLRDTYFNAGPGGAAKTLQQAVGATPDGIIGPKTKAAVMRTLKESGDTGLLAKLHAARWNYMRGKSRNPGKSQFWQGWQNRMNSALLFAKTL